MSYTIAYYSPNINFYDLLKAIICKDSEDKTIEFFKNYSGKKYALITSSCRAALYLAYISLDKTGEVITSPLTCRSAIDPIMWSNNIPHFIDINLDNFNIKTDEIINKINEKTVAIQMINHGGQAVSYENIITKIRKYNVTVIEDCAQSFGAKVGNFNSGFYSDISCYSLIKNAYGIGGGILATNSESIYLNAKKKQREFSKFSTNIILYRLLYSIIETKRYIKSFNSIYFWLNNFRFNKSLRSQTNSDEIKKYLVKPHFIFSKLFASRIEKILRLQKCRIELGIQLQKKIIQAGVYHCNKKSKNNSFTKFFIFIPNCKASEIIKKMNNMNIEVKHLEQKFNSSLQTRFDEIEFSSRTKGIESCINYFLVHDHIISLPINEKMSESEIDIVVANLKQLIG